MSKILILGIGNAQVDAIKYCKELGVEVHACSFTECGPGRGLVDYFSVIDIVNIDGVCQYMVDNKINWVYSVGSDVAMPTVSAVSEKLNLPHFISYQAASVCQNKIQLRSLLGNNIQGNITYNLIKAKNDIKSWEEYPCILKPVDSQGQRGVYMLESERDFNRYYEHAIECSRKKELIIEKYIDGPEISVNVYVKDQQIVFVQTSDRISFGGYPGGIIKEHVMPSAVINKVIESKIVELVTRVTKKLNISNGPVYFQMKISNDEPSLIEVTPRLDGCHIWRLIKYFRGIDLMDVSFKHLIEQTCAFESGRGDRSNQYALKFICEKPGKQVDKSKYDIKNALFLEWYYEEGETVQLMNGWMEKVGYYITRGS